MTSFKEEIPTYEIPDDEVFEEESVPESIADEEDLGSQETEQRDNMFALSLSDLKVTPTRQDKQSSLSPSRNLQERENILVTEQREAES